MATTPQLLPYNPVPVPALNQNALPVGLRSWLQNEDTKVQTTTNSLIVAIQGLQAQVAALQTAVTALQAKAGS